MNDYWNDPPDDHPDPPSCPNNKPQCDGSGEYLYDGKTGHVFSCDTCGYQWVVPFQKDPEPEPDINEIEIPEPDPQPCPHGKMENCDACDRQSDFLYDCHREQRKL